MLAYAPGLSPHNRLEAQMPDWEWDAERAAMVTTFMGAAPGVAYQIEESHNLQDGEISTEAEMEPGF